jgi:hypothetical protein
MSNIQVEPEALPSRDAIRERQALLVLLRAALRAEKPQPLNRSGGTNRA